MSDTLSLVKRWALAASTASLLAACSLGALDGYSDGATGVPEAGTDAPSVPDVVATDTSTEPDANVVDTGAKSFCASLAIPARACVDFDDGKIPFGFASSIGGASVVVGDQGKDGTKGLEIAIPVNAPDDGKACISVSLPGPRTALTIELDVRFSSSGTQNYDIINLYSGVDRELGVSVTGTSLQIEEERVGDGGVELNIPTTAVIKNTYQRLKFVMQVDNDVAHTELFVDGASVGKHDAAASNANGSTSFQIGDCLLVGSKGWTAHYDNIVVYETN